MQYSLLVPLLCNVYVPELSDYHAIEINIAFNELPLFTT